MATHIIGIILGIISLILCVKKSITYEDKYSLISGIVFSITMIILYATSSIYHGLNKERLSKKVMQIIDHCLIFIFIASSYTPFSLNTIKQGNVGQGIGITIVVWTVAIIGVILNAIDLKKYKKFSMFCYLLMGWGALSKANVLFQSLTLPGFILLLGAGIAYTIGAIIYGVAKKHKYSHTIFHVFILLGTILQFFSVYCYIL